MPLHIKNLINPHVIFRIGLCAFVILQSQSMSMAQEVDSQIQTVNQDIPPENKLTLKSDTLLLRLKQQQFIFLKLGQKRVYIYQHNGIVKSYPVAIGKPKWETPTGNFKVMEMLKNPGWTNFKTGEQVAPGKNNPLGERWIAFWTDGQDSIGFHGTPDRASVGKAISHGCVRMYNEDILELYEFVKIGTPVIVEN